jgi:hypothetical protein
MAGINYTTFAGWTHQRRKRRAAAEEELSATGGGRPVALFEALVEGGGREGGQSTGMEGLLVELPGGSRMRIESPVQMQMAAQLVTLIAQSAGSRC